MSGDGEAAGVPAVARAGEAPLQASGKKKKLGKKERGRLKAILDGSYVEPVLPVKAPAKAKQARQPYNGGMAPSLLTKYIKESWTTGALLQTCEQYHERMNKIHASASWNMLGRLAASSGADTEWFDTDRVALETLARKTTELVTLSAEDVLVDDDVSGNTNDPRMGARELANVIHGLAKSGCVRVAEDSEEDLKDRKTSEIKTSDDAETPLLSLITACALAITKRGLECNAQECANAVWGFVKVGHVSDCDLFKVLAAAATREANFGNMNPQEMVNAGWAFSRICNSTTYDDNFTRTVASCIDAIAGASTKRLPEFDARGLCNLTCALAKSFTGEKSSNSGSQNSGTVTAALTAIATETTQRVSASKHDIFATENDVNKFSARDVALSSWAFATLDVSDEPLFLALAESSIEKCGNGEFDARGLANVAWAHAKITINESDTRQALFSFLSKALVAECDKASTAIFYATTDYASENKAGMTSRDVANSAWAFAKACHPSASLFTSLCAVSTANDGLERFNNQDLVNTAWAFAKLAVKESVVLMKHARVTITNRAEDNTLTLPNICTLVWAINSCTGGGGGDSADTSTANDFASVSESLASAAERLAYESSPNELAATAWTFADAGEFNTEAHRSLFKTLSKRVSLILLNGAGGDINTSSANSSETSFGDEELDNLEWAFSKAGNPGSVLRVIKQKKKDSTGVLGMAGGKVNSRFDPSSDPSQLKSSSVPGTAKDGKSTLNGDTHGRSSPQDCGTIVVAGGGVGGAAAALALQRNGFTVVVLESDAGFDSRKQGYGLTVQGTDLRDGLGIDLSADDAPSKSHYTFNEHGEILGFYGEAFGKSSGGKQSSTNTPGASSGARFAHVPRQILRLRMLEKVAPGTIKWGCRMSNFEETHNGVKVFLDDGSTIDACLLIGSDGIFSTTRRLLNLNVKGHAQDNLTYCGLCVSLGIVYDAEFKVQLAKERIFETVDGSARVYAMPFTPGSTMWQLSFPCGEEDAKEYSRDTNKLKKKLTELTEKWHDPVPAMLLSTKIENMSGYPVYDRDVLDPTTLRPPDHKKRRVTLMGDAAHPMTPFKAQGANQAVADAVLLARCLTEGVHKFGTIAGVVESLSVFEQKMLQRANRVVKSSREKAREMHSPLALVSNRKSQRDAKGVGAGDMTMVVTRLREQGVNAKHAATMNKQSESSGYDFDDLVEKVGFHGASLKKIVGVDSAPGDDSKKEKTSKKEKKEKKAKKEKSEKRERDDDSRDKKAKKAKRDK